MCEYHCIFPCSISAQSNFAVGAVVNATFGSITEMAFYITALLQGHRAGNKCYAEIVKSALTGTLLGCILFIPVRASVCWCVCVCSCAAAASSHSLKTATHTVHVVHYNISSNSCILCECVLGHLYDHRRLQTQRAAVQQQVGRGQLSSALYIDRRWES